MKNVKKVFILIACLGILISCAKTRLFEDPINIKKNELEAARSVKLSDDMNTKVSNYIDKRIQSIQENQGIDNTGDVSLSNVSSNCTSPASALASESAKSSKFYEIIAVKSHDGITKGYLWNFYGTTYKSFYQELKFDTQGKVVDFVLWTESNKAFYTTVEEDYTASMSSGGEAGESFVQCVARVFKAAQDACDADPVCNLACSLLPTCNPCMAAAAAATCAMN